MKNDETSRYHLHLLIEWQADFWREELRGRRIHSPTRFPRWQCQCVSSHVTSRLRMTSLSHTFRARTHSPQGKTTKTQDIFFFFSTTETLLEVSSQVAH